jgi:P27 family predicted phage terminase small subunit
MVRELLPLGLLAKIDRPALAAYCTLWGRYVEAEIELRKSGAIVKDPSSGYPIQNPYLNIANAALKQMRAFLVEFGLTPSSRSRVKVTKPEKKDPFQAFLDGEDVPDDEDQEGKVMQ